MTTRWSATPRRAAAGLQRGAVGGPADHHVHHIGNRLDQARQRLDHEVLALALGDVADRQHHRTFTETVTGPEPLPALGARGEALGIGAVGDHLDGAPTPRSRTSPAVNSLTATTSAAASNGPPGEAAASRRRPARCRAPPRPWAPSLGEPQGPSATGSDRPRPPPRRGGSHRWFVGWRARRRDRTQDRDRPAGQRSERGCRGERPPVGIAHVVLAAEQPDLAALSRQLRRSRGRGCRCRRVGRELAGHHQDPPGPLGASSNGAVDPFMAPVTTAVSRAGSGSARVDGNMTAAASVSAMSHGCSTAAARVAPPCAATPPGCWTISCQGGQESRCAGPRRRWRAVK